MAKAEEKATTIITAAKGPPTEADVLECLLAMGESWPTQTRPNVSDKAVQGMCLGLVYGFSAGLKAALSTPTKTCTDEPLSWPL